MKIRLASCLALLLFSSLALSQPGRPGGPGGPGGPPGGPPGQGGQGAPGVRIGQANGFLDQANLDVIAGWTCIPSQPGNTLFVSIFVDEQRVGVERANLPRESAVGAQCGGNSNHGFSFTVPRSLQILLSDGRTHTIRAFAQVNQDINGPRKELNQSPRTFVFTNVAPIGFLDTASPSSITGWACDANTFSSPIQVHLYIDNNFVTATTANQPREAAVGGQCGGFSNRGFVFTLTPQQQAQFLPPGSHTIQVFAINVPTGNNPQLSGSPKTIFVSGPPPPTPPPANRPPIGFLDTATRTSASGWACDPDVPFQPIQVHIYINGVFAGATTANMPREAAVGQQCGGNSNAGWTFNFPASVQGSLTSGGRVQAYAINVPPGINPELSGSPKQV